MPGRHTLRPSLQFLVNFQELCICIYFVTHTSPRCTPLLVEVTSKSVEIDHTTQVWLLGTCYDVTNTTNNLVKKTDRDKDGIPPHIQEFLSHAYSVIWMTYR